MNGNNEPKRNEREFVFEWYATNESGELAIGCWETEDEYMPEEYDHAWYFVEYEKNESGIWEETDGGIYWDYADARELCEEWHIGSKDGALLYCNRISSDEFSKIMKEADEFFNAARAAK